jgi:hypothetical protein
MIHIDTHDMIVAALTDPIAADRVRRVLRSLLRQYRFRCRSVKQIKRKKENVKSKQITADVREQDCAVCP